MRTLIGILALALLLVAGCTAEEPARSYDADAGHAVVSDAPGAQVAVNGSDIAVGRTLVNPTRAAAPDVPVAVSPSTSEVTEATGEPWLAGVAWATVVADPDDDPRLETVAERVPTNSTRTPLALQVVAERPSRPHDHTDPGTE